jgi:hypothetical protein
MFSHIIVERLPPLPALAVQSESSAVHGLDLAEDQLEQPDKPQPANV